MFASQYPVKRTNILHIESLQTSIDGVEDVLSTKTAVVCMSVLLLQHVLFHTDTLEQTFSQCPSETNGDKALPFPSFERRYQTAW